MSLHKRGISMVTGKLVFNNFHKMPFCQRDYCNVITVKPVTRVIDSLFCEPKCTLTLKCTCDKGHTSLLHKYIYSETVTRGCLLGCQNDISEYKFKFKCPLLENTYRDIEINHKTYTGLHEHHSGSRVWEQAHLTRHCSLTHRT